jgi:hypothetical protein
MSKILDLLKTLDLIENINVDYPPEEVTLEMLKNEMGNTDFIPDRIIAWRAWCDVMNIKMYNIILLLYIIYNNNNIYE